MQLIEELPRQDNWRMGKFLCRFCKSETILKLRVGKQAKGCGCFRHKKLYGVLRGILTRCTPGAHKAEHYGDRGIEVCDEWKNDPESFYIWAEPRYEHGLFIDRIDVNGNYEPGNCQFITPKESRKNTRHNIWLESIKADVQKAVADGFSMYSVADWMLGLVF